MKIRVNFFLTGEPELFIPLGEWNRYFPDDKRPDHEKFAYLHLTEQQFQNLLRQNAKLSGDYEE